MGKPYSEDLRRGVVQGIEVGHTYEEVAEESCAARFDCRTALAVFSYHTFHYRNKLLRRRAGLHENLDGEEPREVHAQQRARKFTQRLGSISGKSDSL